MRFLDSLRSVLRFRRFELDPVRRRLARAASVDDLREIARRRLPRGVFDYIDGAAEDEISAGRNIAAFRRLEFRPRVLRDVSDVDPSALLLGRRVALPLVLSPTGFPRVAHSQGELAVARAAARAGLPYVLSTLGTRSIEEVRAVSTGDLWFQVYVWRDKELLGEMLQRAAAAERKLPRFDLSPALPPVARALVGAFGIRNGLAARSHLARLRSVSRIPAPTDAG